MKCFRLILIFAMTVNLVAENALLNAIWENRTDKALEIIEKNIFLDFQDSNGLTALMASTFQENTLLVRRLLRNGANFELTDIDGNTALNLAAFTGSRVIAEMLILHGANIESQNFQMRTPLLTAAAKGHSSLVHLLLDQGADFTVRDISGENLLHLAAFHGISSIIQRIPDSSSLLTMKNNVGYYPFHYAIYTEKIHLVDSLVPVSGSNGSFIEQILDDIPIVLQKAPAEAKKSFISQIYSLITTNIPLQRRIVSQILFFGSEEEALLAIETGFSVKTEDLLVAVKKDQFRLVNALLNKNLSVNGKDRYGNTALMLAVENQSENMIDSLLALGAEPDISNLYGITAITIAIHKQNVPIFSKLLQTSKNLTQTDYLGRNYLGHAAEIGSEDMVKRLLDLGLDPGHTQHDGRCAADIALENGHTTLIPLLKIGD